MTGLSSRGGRVGRSRRWRRLGGGGAVGRRVILGMERGRGGLDGWMEKVGGEVRTSAVVGEKKERRARRNTSARVGSYMVMSGPAGYLAQRRYKNHRGCIDQFGEASSRRAQSLRRRKACAADQQHERNGSWALHVRLVSTPRQVSQSPCHDLHTREIR